MAIAENRGTVRFQRVRTFGHLTAVFIFALLPQAGPLATAANRPTALLVSPIHDAQMVRGDDGMDHIEYDLVVISVLPEPVRLSSVIISDTAGKVLKRIDGAALATVTQPLFAHSETTEIPASAAVAIEVDLILPPGTGPERLTHRIVYTLKPGSELVTIFEPLEVDAPEVTINRQPTIVIKPPVKGNGWLASCGCCKPNLHRDLRIAIGGTRIETPETFAVDFNKIKKDRIFDGDGTKNEQHYAFGEDVFAVADRTVVLTQDDKADTKPNVAMVPETKSDYGGNLVVLEIAPQIFAIYAHLQKDSVMVKTGDVVKAGAQLGKVGNTGPSLGPHLHFGLYDKPDLTIGRSLPFVFDAFTAVGAVDLEKSDASHLVILPNSRQVRSSYPLYGGIQNYP